MIFYDNIKEICSKHKKNALFIDMDGTIVEYKVYQPDFITNDTKDVFLNAKPIEIIIDNLKELQDIKNLDLYILTLSKSNIIRKEKKLWLEKYAKFIKKENIIILVRENGDYNSDNRNFIKAKVMKERLNTYDYVMLLDDEHKILKTTQKELQNKGEVFHISSAII
ncbi:MAG: hypothetical protein IJV31_11235 [Clostridia bacterium]|nr:hypothetical protein [Clostridia bacterium]